MNHSIAYADRGTHLKIAILALVAALAVVLVGFSARVDEARIETVRAESSGPAIKAGTVIRFTTHEGTAVRRI
jgi:hypothetical protein